MMIWETIKAKTGYREIFFLTALVVFILMIAVHKDYGLSNDEPIHQAHGEALLDYYRGIDSTAALSPIDTAGNLIETFSAERNEKFRGMNFFGGFFDLTVNYLHSYFPDSDIYEFRHLINAIFGFLMFLFIGLTAKELGNWQTALLAFTMAVLSPRLFGHSFANPKDIPFATIYIMGIHQIIVFAKNLPKIKILNLTFLTLIISISIAIRVSGLLLIIYFLMVAATYLIIDYYKTKHIKTKELTLTIIVSLAVAIGGYRGVHWLWPYAATDFWGPVKVLLKVSSFKVFNAYELFNGNWYNSWEIPLSYVPTWIWISSPVFIQLAIFIIPFVYHRRLRGKTNLFLYSVLLFFTVFPVLFIIIKHSNIYNGIRHLLFIFPTLTVLAAISWQKLLKFLKPTILYFTAITVLTASLLQTFIYSVKAHPYEAMYFSPLTGGNLAVFGKYETDYWGISTKEAVERIAKLTDSVRQTKPVFIKMYYGDRIKVTNYSEKYKNLKYFSGNGNYGWDYEIIYPAAAKFNHKLIDNWPPENTVFQIKANGLPLCAVVRNKYGGLSLKEIVKKYPNETNYINLGLDYYKKGDYVNSILAAQKALKYNPESTLALNNIGAAANALGLYDYGYDYLQKAISTDSTFVLAINNLKVSFDNYDAGKRDRNTLLANTVNAYRIGAYDLCIKYSKILLKRNSNDAVAWNNLCSAYNAKQEYKKAEKACMKALQLQPDFNLARNNLAWARKNLGK